MGEGSLAARWASAQDIENFRANIRAGNLPLPTDATYEGLVKDYYFDSSVAPTTSPAANATANATAVAGVAQPLVTAQSEPAPPPPCTELFCPIYSLAVSPDPLLVAANESAQPDIFMAVGLDSGIQAADFKRKKLNLILLLDVSGSMSSPFDRYYYDQLTSARKQLNETEAKIAKIDVAKEVLSGIIDLLHPDDRFSIILFTDDTCQPKPLGLVRCTNITGLQQDLWHDLEPLGGTNTQEGYDRASFTIRDCKECLAASREEVENRIILITDAQPNQGNLEVDQFKARLQANADQGIYTTTIGVGLDFNTEFIEAIGKVPGANYYSVHSPGEFKKRLVDDFDYAVTPLVFDLSLQVDPSSLAGAEGWKILHVYGSPNPDQDALTGNGTIMNVSCELINTLFPSSKTEEGVKGGVVLLRMRPPTGGANTPLLLTVTYKDRTGQVAASRRTVALPPQALAATAAPAAESSAYYQSTGVRKAVVLARYIDLIRNWLIDQWGMTDHDAGHSLVIPAGTCALFPSEFCNPQFEERFGLERNATTGVCEMASWLVPGACILPTPVDVTIQLGKWERTSEKLVVNDSAKQAIRDFLPYMQSEIVELGDASMEQEVQTMLKLLSAPSTLEP
ncbi:hypothetical protein N2152v2_009026 [Parachlorella kessleri]